MTDRLPPTAAGIARAAAILAEGGLVAFPTDTVYGVAVARSRSDRLDALFALKARPVERRIPVLVASLNDVEAAGFVIDERLRALADRWWPGPLSVVLAPAGGGETVAFRVPDHPLALALIAAAGPLLATSANVSDEPDTLGADEVLIAFATRQDELDAVLDGGPVPGGVPSTVVDLSTDPARILRPGPVSADQLAALIAITD
ncbi:MAG: L-threonylcarbamoyladenylate synthase [Chloroflexota bacterium]